MNTRLALVATLSLLITPQIPAGELERNVARLMKTNEFIRTLVIQNARKAPPPSATTVTHTGHGSGNIVKLDFIPADERTLRDTSGCGRIQTPHGTYGVEGHGDPGAMFYRNGQTCSPVELARWIRHDQRYTPGMTVYLLACETGKGSRSFAQRLADELGAKVVAPTEKLWIVRGGGYTVAREQNGRILGVLPTAMQHADDRRPGVMKAFTPAASRR